MNTKKILLTGLICPIATVITINLQAQYIHENVEKVWETPEELKIPESVLFDKNRDVFFVANIDGNPTDEDGNGFISILDNNGQIKKLKWATGLNAPKGMGITSGKLYVSDITQLVEIDLKDGKIIKKYDAPMVRFLNDVSVGPDMSVYVSDMRDNKIYRLKDGDFLVWKELTGEFNKPNGVYAEKNRLLVGLGDRIISIDYNTKEAKTYIENTGSIDGLVPYGKEMYLISDWQGRTHLVSPDKEKIKLTDTTPQGVNAADIDYVMNRNLLLIPTFSANTIAAYKVQVK